MRASPEPPQIAVSPPSAGASREHSSLWLLILGLLLPTLVTWIYFDLLSQQKSAFQQIAYGLGKAAQFALPLIALWLSRKKPLEPPKYRLSAATGALFGLFVAGLMFAVYFQVLLPLAVMDGPREAALVKVKQFGVGSPAAFIALGLFYSLFHSALEEYYWRWFIFRELETKLPLAPAAIIGGLGFMAHHVLVLAKYFGWDSPLTWLFSLGIAIGGAAWSILYRKGGTLLGPWLSHLLVDAAIFAIGYHLLFGMAK